MFRFVRSAMCLACLVAAVSACSSNSTPTAPTPAPSPAPQPAAATFTVTGTVSETAPTTSTRVVGVQVSLPGGLSATTDAAGMFTLSGVAEGTYTLTASKSEYESTMLPITVPAGGLMGVNVSLAPTPRVVDVELQGQLGPEDPSCHGTTRPCDAYPVGAHHSGTVRIFLVWTSKDTNLDLELRCGGEVVAEQANESGVIEEMITDVVGGRACELFVLYTGDAPEEYGIFLTYPY